MLSRFGITKPSDSRRLRPLEPEQIDGPVDAARKIRDEQMRGTGADSHASGLFKPDPGNANGRA